MKILKISAELIEQQLIQGNEIEALKVTKGLSSNCRLVNAKFSRDDRILELWFAEVEGCEDMVIEITIKDEEAKNA